MKRLAHFLLLPALVAACCAAPALAQDPKPGPSGEFVTDRPSPEYVPDSWKEFSPEGGRFRVMLPGTPTRSVQSLDSPYGKLERHEFGLRTFAFYAVGYIDFPEKDGPKDVKAFFDGVRTGTLASTKAELLEEKDDNRFGSPGRSIKARLASGHVNRIRLHLIGKRFYTLFVIMPEQGASADSLKFYEETAAKFLDSFKPADAAGRVTGAVLRAPYGAEIDPALLRSRPLSRKGEPEPAAGVSGGILNGKARRLPAPEYPPQAKEARAAGKVEVRVVVDESGKVIWASAAGGHASLLEASEEAAYRAEFEPITLQGKPVRVKGVLLYNFIARTR